MITITSSNINSGSTSRTSAASLNQQQITTHKIIIRINVNPIMLQARANNSVFVANNLKFHRFRYFSCCSYKSLLRHYCLFIMPTLMVMKLLLIFVCLIFIPGFISIVLCGHEFGNDNDYGSEFGHSRSSGYYRKDALIRDWKRKCAKYLNGTNGVRTRVTGGSAAEENMFPYQTGLLMLDDGEVFQCGGSLIAPQFVLTAAHCIEGASFGKVFLGSTRFADSTSPSAVVFNVTSRDFHFKEFNYYDSFYDDIALIRLPQPLPLSAAIQTIPLAPIYMIQEFLEGEYTTSSGWGLTGDNATSGSKQLNYVDVSILPVERCACFYLPGIVNEYKHICADGANGRGSCDGDSGGPLTYYFKNTTYQVGVTVFGSAGGCEIGFPSVFMRITSYRNWIVSKISEG